MPYNPSLHTTSNKSYGLAQAGPVDARSYFYDEALYIYRPYQNTAEVLAYLDQPRYRMGHFRVMVNAGGTLNPDGTFSGGTYMGMWFLNGMADSDLIAGSAEPTGTAGGDLSGTYPDPIVIWTHGLIVYDAKYLTPDNTATLKNKTWNGAPVTDPYIASSDRWDAKQNAIGFTPENTASKNIPGGYAGVDNSGFIPATLIPASVDDVLEYPTRSAFPATGVQGKMYVALDTNKIYRWSGSTYIEISPSPGSTDSVPEGSVNLYFIASRAVAALTGQSISIFTQDANNRLTTDNEKAIWNAKQSALPVGSSLQYLRGNQSLATFPVNVSYFSNDAGYALAANVLPLTGGTVNGNLIVNGTLSSTQKFQENIFFNTQSGTAYTVAAADASAIILMNNANANTVTFPSGLGSNIRITVISVGTGQTTIVAGGGVTINSTEGALKLRTQYSAATLISSAADVFIAVGDLVT